MFNSNPPKSGRQSWSPLHMTVVLVSLLLTIPFVSTMAQSTYNPLRYWTFNGSNATTDSMGTYNLNFTTYNSPYTIENNGRVGKFLTLGSTTSLIDGGAVSLTNAMTLEFLIKPGYAF